MAMLPELPAELRDLQEMGVTLFAGEAEETFARFLELAPRRNSRDLLPEIPGLAYRYGGRVWHNTLPHDGYGRSLLDVDGSVCGTSLALPFEEQLGQRGK
jgi:hypothetical protein